MHACPSTLLPQEKQAILSIASIYALRMLGLFMLVPVLSLYVQHLDGATPFYIGVALGCYGLTQALFQIPLGTFSDFFGRKTIIAFGLILFASGGIIAALSTHIWGIILGRSLQGAGAVGSATNALLADLTRADQRIKGMAVIGITIGGAFAMAMVGGPLLNSWFSVPIIFWITVVFALLALLILQRYVPTPSLLQPSKNISRHFRSILANRNLLQLNGGIFILHAVLTANFVVLPLVLQNQTGLSANLQWQLYLPTLLVAFIVIVPLLRFTHKTNLTKKLFLVSIAVLLIAELMLSLFQHSLWKIGIALCLFFIAFTLLEAMIPSQVSKLAAPEYRGAAMGVNSTCQFLGIFIGGSLSGWLYGSLPASNVLVLCAFLVGIWLIFMFRRLTP